MELNRHPGYSEYIRRNAISSPLTWDVLAHAWSGHWDWLLGLRSLEVTSAIFERCSICNGNWLMLADGLHCAGCGQYQKYAARIEHRRGYDEQLPFS